MQNAGSTALLATTTDVTGITSEDISDVTGLGSGDQPFTCHVLKHKFTCPGLMTHNFTRPSLMTHNFTCPSLKTRKLTRLSLMTHTFTLRVQLQHIPLICCELQNKAYPNLHVQHA